MIGIQVKKKRRFTQNILKRFVRNRIAGLLELKVDSFIIHTSKGRFHSPGFNTQRLYQESKEYDMTKRFALEIAINVIKTEYNSQEM